MPGTASARSVVCESMTQEQTRTPSIVLEHPTVVMTSAAAAGVAFDLLAFGRPHGPGLATACLALTAAVWWPIRSRAGSEPTLVAAVAAGAAVVPALRSSPVVATLAILTWFAALSVLAARARGWSFRTWTIGTFARASLEPLAALGEPFALVTDDIGGLGSGRLARLARLLPIARGLLFAAMVVGFFAILFGSADPIFARLASDALDIDLSFERIIRFGVVAGVAAWWTVGMARRGARTSIEPTPVRPAGRGLVESRVVLLTLNGLFALFLAVQFRYLFDGRVGRVDLGYAEYARRGFFELVTVAACVVGLILAVDWIVNRRDRMLDTLHLLLVVQTFVIMGSAVIRMGAYVEAFGLSELRLYTSVFMLWTAVVLVAVVATVLRGRRAAFAAIAAGTAVLTIFSLAAVNPDGAIARVNLDRAVGGADLDVDYLLSLSSDAVPVSADRLASLPADAAGHLRPALATWQIRLADDAATEGWRSWTLGDHRASRALQSLGD